MYTDFGFSFPFLSTAGKEARAKRGFQLSSLTWNLSFLFCFQSGLLRRANLFGDMNIYMNRTRLGIYTTGYSPSLVCGKMHEFGWLCWPFSIPASPWRKQVLLLQDNLSLCEHAPISAFKMQTLRPQSGSEVSICK